MDSDMTCNDHDALTYWCSCGYTNNNPTKPTLSAEDNAREELSRANTRLGLAARNVWARQAEYDAALVSGDDFDIIHASLALTTASKEHDRRTAEYEAAGERLRQVSA